MVIELKIAAICLLVALAAFILDSFVEGAFNEWHNRYQTIIKIGAALAIAAFSIFIIKQ